MFAVNTSLHIPYCIFIGVNFNGSLLCLFLNKSGDLKVIELECTVSQGLGPIMWHDMEKGVLTFTPAGGKKNNTQNSEFISLKLIPCLGITAF